MHKLVRSQAGSAAAWPLWPPPRQVLFRLNRRVPGSETMQLSWRLTEGKGWRCRQNGNLRGAYGDRADHIRKRKCRHRTLGLCSTHGHRRENRRHQLYVMHDITRCDFDSGAGGFSGGIYGHSHQPRIDRRDNVLSLNPGINGLQRFQLPVSYALLRICDGPLVPEFIRVPA